MELTEVSAGIPVYTGSSLLPATVANLREQGVHRILVIDDGSTENTGDLATRLGAEVVEHLIRKGRGAARARIMSELKTDFVLQIDAGNLLEPNFIALALAEMRNPEVAAVFGKVRGSAAATNAVARWSDRHLFKTKSIQDANEHASLMTGAVLLRRAHVLGVGNFSEALQAREDLELGNRLLSAGWKVQFNPNLTVITGVPKSWRAAFERYFRWNINGRIKARGYLRQAGYAYKCMLAQDLADHDYASAVMTLLLPHYLFIRSRGLD